MTKDQGEVAAVSSGVPEQACKHGEVPDPMHLCTKTGERPEPPMLVLFAFDCMRVPINKLRNLSSCLELLPPLVNELFSE